MHFSDKLSMVTRRQYEEKYNVSTEGFGWLAGGIAIVYGVLKLGEYLRDRRIKSETYDDYMKLLNRADAMLKIFPKVTKIQINIEGIDTFKKAHKVITGKFSSVERELSKVGFSLYVYDGANHSTDQNDADTVESVFYSDGSVMLELSEPDRLYIREEVGVKQSLEEAGWTEANVKSSMKMLKDLTLQFAKTYDGYDNDEVDPLVQQASTMIIDEVGGLLNQAIYTAEYLKFAKR